MTSETGPNWERRRRFMYCVTLWIALAITWVLYKGLDTQPAEAMVTIGLITIGGIVGSYVFSATWQDVRLKK